VADLLRDFLADRPAGQALWGGTWARDRKAAEMLRYDLEAAGVPYVPSRARTARCTPTSTPCATPT
jgi:hypothetical protein